MDRRNNWDFSAAESSISGRGRRAFSSLHPHDSIESEISSDISSNAYLASSQNFPEQADYGVPSLSALDKFAVLKRYHSKPATTPASLTVAENSLATPIGIVAPTDPHYSTSQLTVTVTGLPTDGTVLLAGGTTAVTVGESLTVAQLTGLEFQPIKGLFDASSTFTYKVTDPSGLSANGSVTLTIAADSMPPSTTLASLTVAQNAGATPIGIAAPVDPNYSASELTVSVTSLPGNGVILLADGVTQVGLGALLTVAQLTGLMFKPTANAFGSSSAFEYEVFDPAGLTAFGSAMLAIGPDTMPPATTDPLLTVAPNSAATAIGIPTPSDPVFSISQLTVTVTGLPTDGTIVLADGVTPVSEGETLTVAQLTTLMFAPTAGLSGVSSDFTYMVTNPAGLSATGLEQLAISGTNGISPDGSTLVPGTGGDLVTSAGTWSLSTDWTSSGYAILLNGQPAAGGYGTELEVSNNGNLYALDAYNKWWEWVNGNWSEVANPNGGSTGNGGSTSNGGGSNGGSGVVDMAPALPQPSQSGDIVAVRLQNTGSTTEANGYVTFGQIFRDGALKPTETLVARINGVNYAVQMDVLSTYGDGSIKQAVLTLDAPQIAAGGTLDLILAKGTAGSLFQGTAPSAAALLGSGYDLSVNFTFHNPDGTTTTDSASAAAALQAALNSGSVTYWLAGPGVNEFIVQTTVDGGKLKLNFDIRAYANGVTTTDVIFDNSWMFSPGKNDLNYDVSMSQGGQQVYSAAGVQQYLYSMWDHQVASAGMINPNVQYDIAYLIAIGAIPAYDFSFGVADSAIQSNLAALNATNTGPMGTAGVDTYMPGTGGRQDIAPQPNWVAQWLLSQNAAAFQVMMADAEASGGIPWHYTDESTGEPINAQTYPMFTINEDFPQYGFVQPANGWPLYSNTGSPSADGDPWMPDAAHMPDLNYVSYLITGSYYQLQLLQAQADYAITSVLNSGTALDTSGTVPLGFADSFSGNGNIYSSNGNQLRSVAWELREVAEAAYITPDNDLLKSYFTSELDTAMNGLVQEYIVDNINGIYGQLNGFLQGSSGPNTGVITPYEEDEMVTALGIVAGLNIPQASAQAVQMLNFMDNFVAGVFTNGPNGFNPLDGTAYWIGVNGATGADPYTTWSQLFNANLDPTWQTGNAGLPAQPTELINWPTDTIEGYGPVAEAALAVEITYTQSAQAIQAFGLLVSQITYAFDIQNTESEAAAYQAAPAWNFMPKLPDGTYLQHNQMQIDTSNASTVNLTANGGDALLAVVGSGSATLISDSAEGGCDLLYGGSGPTTLIAAAGNDYMFGGGSGSSYVYNGNGALQFGPQQTTTFVDGTGNDYMYGGTGANVYQFLTNNIATSRSTTIANFNISTDTLQVAANLDGYGLTSASQLIAGATTSNGNTVLHLSPNDQITLLGISQPSSLLSHIVVS